MFGTVLENMFSENVNDPAIKRDQWEVIWGLVEGWGKIKKSLHFEKHRSFKNVEKRTKLIPQRRNLPSNAFRHFSSSLLTFCHQLGARDTVPRPRASLRRQEKAERLQFSARNTDSLGARIVAHAGVRRCYRASRCVMVPLPGSLYWLSTRVSIKIINRN